MKWCSFAARGDLFHLQPPCLQYLHDGIGTAAAALQWGPAVGDDWGAAVPNALQKGPAHQEVHQDCISVSGVLHTLWQRDKTFIDWSFTGFEIPPNECRGCGSLWWQNSKLHLSNFLFFFHNQITYILFITGGMPLQQSSCCWVSTQKWRKCRNCPS